MFLKACLDLPLFSAREKIGTRVCPSKSEYTFLEASVKDVGGEGGEVFIIGVGKGEGGLSLD